MSNTIGAPNTEGYELAACAVVMLGALAIAVAGTRRKRLALAIVGALAFVAAGMYALSVLT